MSVKWLRLLCVCILMANLFNPSTDAKVVQVPGNPAWNWHKASELPIGLGGANLITDADNLYILGGDAWVNETTTKTKIASDKIYQYNPPENAWHEYGTLPSGMINGCVGFWDGYIYLMGGKNNHHEMIHQLWRSPLKKIHWELLGTWQAPTWGNVSMQDGSYLYSYGGWTSPGDSGAPCNELWRWNLKEPRNAPEKLAASPGQGRCLLGGAAHDGIVYIFGGLTLENGKATNLSDAWSYSAAHNKWNALANMPSPPFYAARALWLRRDSIFLFGGYGKKSGTETQQIPEEGQLDSIWRYDPTQNTYSHAGNLPGAVCDMPFIGFGTHILGTGGEDRGGHRATWLFIGDAPDAVLSQ